MDCPRGVYEDGRTHYELSHHSFLFCFGMDESQYLIELKLVSQCVAERQLKRHFDREFAQFGSELGPKSHSIVAF